MKSIPWLSLTLAFKEKYCGFAEYDGSEYVFLLSWRLDSFMEVTRGFSGDFMKFKVSFKQVSGGFHGSFKGGSMMFQKHS